MKRMVLTRKQRKDALEHVLCKVLEEEPNSDLRTALAYQKKRDIIKIVNLTEAEINAMSYKDDTGNTQTLMKGDIGLLRAFTAYVGHKHSTGDPIGEDWLSIPADDFDQY